MEKILELLRLTNDTFFTRIIIEFGNVVLVVGLVYLISLPFEKMRQKKAYGKQDEMDFDYAVDVVIPRSTLPVNDRTGLLVFIMIVNAVIAGTAMAISEFTRTELLTANTIRGHLLWTAAFAVGASLSKAKGRKIESQDKKTDRMMTGMYQYLRSKTDKLKSKKFMRLVCEIMDQSNDTQKILDLIEEVNNSDRPLLELGEYSIRKIVSDFMYPECGASGWFHLSESGKSVYTEMSELLDQQ